MKTRVLEMQGTPSLSTFLKGWNALLRCHHIQDKHVEEGDPAACWASKFTSTVEPGGTKPWIKFTVKNNNSSMNNRKVKCLHFTSEILRNPTRSTRLWEKGPLLWLCCFGSESETRSVVSNSLRPHGLYSPWNSPGQNTGVGSLSLL